jgi:hypothetical protein
MPHLRKITPLVFINIAVLICSFCFYGLHQAVAEDNNLEKIKKESVVENLNKSSTADPTLKFKEKDIDKKLEVKEQTGFIFIPKEIELIAGLILTVFSILVALLSLIGKDNDYLDFYTDYPLSKTLRQDTLLGKFLIPIFKRINVINTILWIEFSCVLSILIGVFGYIPFIQSHTLINFVEIAEMLLVFIALLFFNVLLRGVTYYLAIARSR